jgi:poly(A) polymerase
MGEAASAFAGAVWVIRQLRAAGHEAYLAGGCVRDALLGVEPKDFDVATDARPDRVRRLFRRSKYVGEAFGVCLVYAGRHAIEVATFRAEAGYTDGRRPDHVEFTDAEHDAQRRDFTINGLFADPLPQGASAPPAAQPDWAGCRIIDHVGGVADLRAGIVRAIGDPDERFGEDYLRMLRAVRFAARLGFDIETRTAAAIRPLAKYLGQISRERIGQEVAAMLGPPSPATRDYAAARAVALMGQLRLDGVVLNDDHRETTPAAIRRLDRVAAYPTALAAWMIDRYVGVGDPVAITGFIHHEAPRLIGRWRNALSLSNTDRDALRDILTRLEHLLQWPALSVARRKRLLASPLYHEAVRLLRAADAPEHLRAVEHDAAPLLAQGVAPPPLLTGDDLIAMGLQPGPAFGPLLDALYDAQLEAAINTREEAIAWVRAREAGSRE